MAASIPIPLTGARAHTHVSGDEVDAARAALLVSLDTVPIYRIAIELEAVTPVALSFYPGSALRGAVVQALLDTHCSNKAAPSCAACPLVMACPVAALVAPMRDEAPRGRDVPRPFTITPPALDAAVVETGARFTFGLTLFGRAAALFPYVVLSRPRLEANGLGIRNEAGRRGRVAVRRISSLGDGTEAVLYSPGVRTVGAPREGKARSAIALRAEALPAHRLTLRFITPMRLVADGMVQPRVRPSTLVHRILERWEGIRREYATPGMPDPLAPLRGAVSNSALGDPRVLLAVADTVEVARDDTHWLDLASYSSRQRRFTPIGGVLGDLTLAGPLAALSEVLALGEVIHAGKDVVKGNGCFTVAETGRPEPWN